MAPPSIFKTVYNKHSWLYLDSEARHGLFHASPWCSHSFFSFSLPFSLVPKCNIGVVLSDIVLKAHVPNENETRWLSLYGLKDGAWHIPCMIMILVLFFICSRSPWCPHGLCLETHAVSEKGIRWFRGKQWLFSQLWAVLTHPYSLTGNFINGGLDFARSVLLWCLDNLVYWESDFFGISWSFFTLLPEAIQCHVRQECWYAPRKGMNDHLDA